MKILLPELNGRIAPCFEVSKHFIVAEISHYAVSNREELFCPGDEGYRRIRLLSIHDIEMLVCNGIEGFYLDLAYSMGVKVIYGVSLSIDEALKKLLLGELVSPPPAAGDDTRDHHVPLKKLVTWTAELFKNHGYQVKSGPGQDSFLIDLVAELSCPVCEKIIKVAICCGAHTYRTEQEIREFHYCAKSGYNARAFVCPPSTGVEVCCREYGIELIRYISAEMEPRKTMDGIIPLLRGPIAGHEKATLTQTGQE